MGNTRGSGGQRLAWWKLAEFVGVTLVGLGLILGVRQFAPAVMSVGLQLLALAATGSVYVTGLLQVLNVARGRVTLRAGRPQGWGEDEWARAYSTVHKELPAPAQEPLQLPATFRVRVVAAVAAAALLGLLLLAALAPMQGVVAAGVTLCGLVVFLLTRVPLRARS